MANIIFRAYTEGNDNPIEKIAEFKGQVRINANNEVEIMVGKELSNKIKKLFSQELISDEDVKFRIINNIKKLQKNISRLKWKLDENNSAIVKVEDINNILKNLEIE